MKKFLPLIVISIFLLLYLVPIGQRPLFSPDESRYGEIAREMVVSGNYVSPRLNGVRYFEKPVLGYWVIAGSMKIFGENNFAIRLPMMLFTGIAAWFLWLFTLRTTGERKTAYCAVGIFLTTPLVFVLGGICILDSPFSALLTMTAVSFYFAWMNKENRKKQILWSLAAGIFAGLAFLTKGFLGFAIPAIIAIPFLVWERRWKDMLVLPWIPFIAAIAVIAPWAILIHQQEPDFWHYFIFVEHINRFLGGAKAQHPAPFYFFIPILIGGMCPWTLLVPDAVRGYRKTDLQRSDVRYLICWAFVPFLFFSCSSGKLATYILPCFAPLAVLLANGLTVRMEDQQKSAWFRWTCFILSGALAMAVVGLITIQAIPNHDLKLFGPRETGSMLVMIGAALCCIICLILAARTKYRMMLFLTGLLPLVLASQLSIPARFLTWKAITRDLELHRARIPENAEFVTYLNQFQAVCWTFKRTDVWQIDPGENEYGMSQPDAKHRKLQLGAFPSFLKQCRDSGKTVVLFVDSDRYRKMLKRLKNVDFLQQYDDVYLPQEGTAFLIYR